MMTPEQFEHHLDIYGSDFRRWPDDLAKRAQDLLGSSASARALLDEALLLDDMLSTYTVAEPDAAFEARLLNLAPATASAASSGLSDRTRSWFSLRLLSAAAASLACAAFGFVIGLQSISSIQTTNDAEAFMSASITGLSEDFWTGEEG